MNPIQSLHTLQANAALIIQKPFSMRLERIDEFIKPLVFIYPLVLLAYNGIGTVMDLGL